MSMGVPSSGPVCVALAGRCPRCFFVCEWCRGKRRIRPSVLRYAEYIVVDVVHTGHLHPRRCPWRPQPSECGHEPSTRCGSFRSLSLFLSWGRGARTCVGARPGIRALTGIEFGRTATAAWLVPPTRFKHRPKTTRKPLPSSSLPWFRG